MIGPELEGEILRLYHVEKWRVGTIAAQLRLHHSTVRRVIDAEGKPRERKKRQRMIDPYIPFVVETFRKYPRITISRVYNMAKERGYPGRPTQFRDIAATLRPPRSTEAYLKLRTLPAEEAQVDWAHFGRLQIGRASRPLMAFVMVLSYCRAIFLRFFLSQSLSNFLYGHEFAFRWFGGHCRKCLYDNLKSVVLERIGQATRFNPQFLSFAAHWRFQPKPVAPYRGNEKGRVERAIRYIRTNFFAARRFKDLDDLNSQALRWCEGPALERKWPEDRRRTVGEVFSEEKKLLLALAPHPFPCEERLEVEIGKYPYARFDLNDYSVPHTLADSTLVVVASLDKVRILDGNEVVARHLRSYSRGEQVEDAMHIKTLSDAKAAAGAQRRTHLLAEACPASTKLLKKVAERGLPLGRATNELLELLRTYGREELEAAVIEALQGNAPHPQAVRHILDRKRREAGKRPARPLSLPDDPRVRDLLVKPHDLKTYDNIEEDSDE